ncbi:Protein phosphatase 2C-like protein 5 [Elsinoe fawcettii]|nr:Protein phosphatase 2C-like protein 5 [Elsinoe fawcettii]
MGQTLSEPVVDKKSESGQDDRIAYGISCMQGWRINMEDAHACILDLQPLEGEEELKPAASDIRISFFGVYDGHGGDKVAIYTGENLHKIIAKQEAFKKGQFEQALKDGFLAIDRSILSDPRYEDEVSGCTASVAICTKDRIFVGNAGDSRTVLGVKGRAKPLSFDHKPQNEGEKARICAAGGFVDFGRVNGNLALSRAIGDFEFKKSADLPPEQQIVTAFPDVTVHDISEDDEFLVIACDGIWDCQSSQAVVEFVRRGIAAKQELQLICENMMDNCLASNSETGGVGCDNMTMSVIALLRGKTLDEWYQLVADRVTQGDGPCAPPEYAEFRGPGVHHHFDNDSDEYDVDLDQRTRMLTSRAGRIILLGDGGAEFHADADSADQDTEMFDQSDEEEKDLESQVKKGQAEATASERSKREETPGPEDEQTNQQKAEESASKGTGPGSTPAEPKMSAATDGAAKES